jgi:hypothetical protein
MSGATWLAPPTHEHFTSAFLVVLMPVRSGLNVNVRLPEKDQLNHERDPRILSFTASQVVNSLGLRRNCSIRRSNSAMISRETGNSEGCPSRSFHNSETTTCKSRRISLATLGAKPESGGILACHWSSLPTILRRPTARSTLQRESHGSITFTGDRGLVILRARESGPLRPYTRRVGLSTSMRRARSPQ